MNLEIASLSNKPSQPSQEKKQDNLETLVSQIQDIDEGDLASKDELANKIRRAITEKYPPRAISKISAEELADMKKYLDIAKSLTAEKERREWENKMKILGAGEFSPMLESKDIPYIKIKKFAVGVNDLKLNGKIVRRINGITFFLDIDRGDKRAEGLADTVVGDNLLKTKKKEIAYRRAQDELMQKLKTSLIENLDTSKGIIFVSVNKQAFLERAILDKKEKTNILLGKSNLQNREDFGCDISIDIDLNDSNGEETNLDFKEEIKKNADKIIEQLNKIYYKKVQKVGRVLDGGNRYKR